MVPAVALTLEVLRSRDLASAHARLEQTKLCSAESCGMCRARDERDLPQRRQLSGFAMAEWCDRSSWTGTVSAMHFVVGMLFCGR